MRALSLILCLPLTASAWTVVIPDTDAKCVNVAEHRVTLDVGPDGAAAVTELSFDLAEATEVDVLVPPGVVTLDGSAIRTARLGTRGLADMALACSRPTLVGMAGHAVETWRLPLEAGRHVLRVESAPSFDGRHVVMPLQNFGTACHRPQVQVEARVETTEGLGAVFAPYHDLPLLRPDANRAAFTLHTNGDHDLHLYLTTGEALVATSHLTWWKPTCEGEDPEQLLLLAAGPTTTEVDDAGAKDVVLVVDRSGSMSGDKIEQVRRAMRAIIGKLGPRDRFEVVTFAGDVAPTFGGLEDADDERVADAQRVVDRMRADGSTDIHGALMAGLSAVQVGGSGRPRMMVFLTDGQATAGVTDNERILADVERANEAGVRVFAFGVGNDVNTWLLDELGRRTNAATHYIRPGADIDAALVDFYRDIQAPVLTDVTLDDRGAGISELLPRALPDLFVGSQLFATSKLEQAGRFSVALEGQTAGGDDASYEEWLTWHGERHPFLPRLWASRRMAELLYEARQNPDDEATVDEIKALAWRHGFHTRFTNFVAGEGGRVAAGYSNPTADEVGDEAVGTSSDINEMSGNSNADAYSDAENGGSVQMLQVRDRTFVLDRGYWRDTTIAVEAATIDVVLGGDDWRALVDAGAAPLLAVGRNVMFRWRCRTVRVTDPEVEDAPAATPVPAELLEPPADAPVDTPPPAPLEPLRDRAEGCSSTGTGGAWWLLLLALARRRRTV